MGSSKISVLSRVYAEYMEITSLYAVWSWPFLVSNLSAGPSILVRARFLLLGDGRKEESHVQ